MRAKKTLFEDALVNYANLYLILLSAPLCAVGLLGSIRAFKTSMIF